MALPTTGQLSLNDINVELGNSSGSQASLRSMSAAAGKPTSNATVSNFYGYSGGGSISVSTLYSSWSNGSSLAFNTLTSTGAWTAIASDPNGAIDSYTQSGSGSQKVSFSYTWFGFGEASGSITYFLTGDSATAVWQWCINGTNLLCPF